MRLKIAKSLLVCMGIIPGLAGAQGFGLPAVSFAAGGAGLTSFYVIGFELGPWQEYLAQELTPDYMLPDDAQPLHVTWLKNSEVRIMPDFAAYMESQPDTRINYQFEWQADSQLLWPGFEPEGIFEGTSFERQYFAPGMEHEFTEGSILGVSAVIAYQRYSAASLGLTAASSPARVPGYPPPSHRRKNPVTEPVCAWPCARK